MSLIPVNFSFAYYAIRQAHQGSAFKLSPTASTIGFLQTHNLLNGVTNCNCFDIINDADYLKFHTLLVTVLIVWAGGG